MNPKDNPKDIDDYIAGFPNNVQEKLKKIRRTIRKAAPDAEETIKYRMPTYTLKGNLLATKTISGSIRRPGDLKSSSVIYLRTKVERVR
jgi:hypothetical protein